MYLLCLSVLSCRRGPASASRPSLRCLSRPLQCRDASPATSITALRTTGRRTLLRSGQCAAHSAKQQERQLRSVSQSSTACACPLLLPLLLFAEQASAGLLRRHAGSLPVLRLQDPWALRQAADADRHHSREALTSSRQRRHRADRQRVRQGSGREKTRRRNSGEMRLLPSIYQYSPQSE